MCKIYQRFDSGVSSSAQKTSPPAGRNANRPTERPATPQRQQQSQNGQHQHRNPAQSGHQPQQAQNTNQQHKSSEPQNNYSKQAHSSPQKPNSNDGGINKILGKFLPTSVYNPNTKKLFGVLSAEDLLLVALIFLFLGSDDEDSSLLVLALAFVLLSDFIDFSSFAF